MTIRNFMMCCDIEQEIVKLYLSKPTRDLDNLPFPDWKEGVMSLNAEQIVIQNISSVIKNKYLFYL